MQTIYTSRIDEIRIEDFDYNFQEILTPILDKFEGDFNQEIINQIVLWKVNRYASIEATVLDKLNSLNKQNKEIDIELTRQILNDLLNTKGIQLPMASTILRFKNPNIYQIIDQRVYRFIMGVDIDEPYAIPKKIDYYLNYLKQLESVCKEFNINFNESDRVLYVFDKKLNSDKPLKNY